MKFFLGLLMGVAIAAGVAFYLNKSQNPFTNNVATNSSEVAGKAKLNASNPIILMPTTGQMEQISSAPASDKHAPESYDFYDILAGKKNPTPPALNNQAQQNTPKPNPTPNTNKAQTANDVANIINNIPGQNQQPVVKPASYIVQAGAFSNPETANDMQAKLALIGLNAQISTKTNNNGNTIYKVILGPFSENQIKNIRDQLSQQNISYSTININK